MKIIRVFPRRTKLTPDDENVRVDCLPGLFDGADEIHISVLFREDLPKAERLTKEWSRVAPVKIGGVATGEFGGNFVPGMYVKKGAVITSRGCPNRCWFCSAWRNEGNIVRELPVTNGWNVLDNNLLRCSESHVRGVFDMLQRQPERAMFTGGFEAAVLKDWHIDLLVRLKPKTMFFAYDFPSNSEALRNAGKRLIDAGFTRASHTLRTYCLIGWQGDSFARAETRLRECFDAGFVSMAMLYRDGTIEPMKDWKQFARVWARPAIVCAKMKSEVNHE